VRSYEEQWTEDEFEKLCQVEAPGSPNPNELKEKDLSNVTTESKMVIGAEGVGSSNIQPTQPSEYVPAQQIEVNPPPKRGRGRPKKNKTGISSIPIGLPVSPLTVSYTVKSVDPTVNPLGIQTVPGSGSGSQLNVTSLSGSSSNPPDSGQSTITLTSAPLAVPPGFQPTADHPPGFQPTSTLSYKPLTTPPGYQPLATPPGYQQITHPPPGFQPKITSPPPHSSSQTTSTIVANIQSTPTVLAGPQSITTNNTCVPTSTLSSPTLPVGPVSLPMLSPTSPDSPSAISPSAVTSVRGRGRGRGRGRAQGRGRGRGHIVESEVDLVSQRRGKKQNHIVLAIPGLQSSPVGKPETGSSVSMPGTGSLLGKPGTDSSIGEPETGSSVNKLVTGSSVGKPETCSSVGKPETGSSAAPSTASETANDPLVSKPTPINVVSNTEVGVPVSALVMTVPSSEVSKSDLSSPRPSVPAVSAGKILMDIDVGTMQTAVSGSVEFQPTALETSSSQTVTPLVTVPVSSLSVSPDSAKKKGRGRGRRDQSGVGPHPQPPRRRVRREKDDTADAQDQKSNEPEQKRTRASSGRKTVATRSMARNQSLEIAEPLLRTSSNMEEKSNILEVDALSKSADASRVDDNISTNGEKAGPKHVLVASESGSKSHDTVEVTKPKEDLDPSKSINLVVSTFAFCCML